jgi:hypothetical protein
VIPNVVFFEPSPEVQALSRVLVSGNKLQVRSYASLLGCGVRIFMNVVDRRNLIIFTKLPKSVAENSNGRPIRPPDVLLRSHCARLWKHAERILDPKIANAQSVLEIFAVKSDALAFERSSYDHRIVPCEAISFGKPQRLRI